MTEQQPDPQNPPEQPAQQPGPPPAYAEQPAQPGPPPAYAEQQVQPGPPPAYSPQQYGAPAGYAQSGQPGQVGEIRSTGLCILLYFVTLGIYGLFYYYKTHEEMKRYSGQGIGGLVALLLALFIGIVMPFFTSSEAGDLYTREGREAPVTAGTGLWYFPGIFIIVGPFIWFAKTNAALNDFWASKGAVQS